MAKTDNNPTIILLFKKLECRNKVKEYSKKITRKKVYPKSELIILTSNPKINTVGNQ